MANRAESAGGSPPGAAAAMPEIDPRLEAAEAQEGASVAAGGDPLLPSGSGETTPPPIQLRSLGGNALLFTALALISNSVSFVMLPLYTHYLSPADYGAIELIEMSLDIATVIAGSRLLGGVFRFYYKATTDDERHGVISTAMWTVCGSYAIVGLLAFLAAPLLAQLVLGTQQYTSLVRLGALAIATSAPTFVPTPYLQAQGRFRVIFAAQLSRLAIQVTLNALLLIVAHLGAKSMFLSTLVANVCVGGVLGTIVLRDVGLRYVRRAAADLYRFGLPLMVTQVATFVLTYGDRYFLRTATTLTDVGLYTLGYRFAFVLVALTQTPFDMVWGPKRHEVAKRSDRDAIYARVFVYLNIVVLGGAVGVALFVRSVLHILTGPSYWAAAAIVPVLLPYVVLQAWSSFQDIGIIISERTKWIAVSNWGAAVVVLAAYALLIPRYGAWGAATATVIGYMVRYGGIYRASQRLWPVRYTWPPAIYLVLLSIATVVAGVTLPAGPLGFDILSRAVLFALYLSLVWRLPILSEAERRGVRRVAADLLETGAGRLKRGTSDPVVP